MKTRADAIVWIREQDEQHVDSDDLDAALRALGYDPDALRGDDEDPTDRRWDVACSEASGARRPMREGYIEHDHSTEWQECDTCGLRLGAGITTPFDDAYYADGADTDACPRPGCDGRMGLPA